MSTLNLSMRDHDEWLKDCPICGKHEVMPVEAGKAKCYACGNLHSSYEELK